MQRQPDVAGSGRSQSAVSIVASASAVIAPTAVAWVCEEQVFPDCLLMSSASRPISPGARWSSAAPSPTNRRCRSCSCSPSLRTVVAGDGTIGVSCTTNDWIASDLGTSGARLTCQSSTWVMRGMSPSQSDTSKPTSFSAQPGIRRLPFKVKSPRVLALGILDTRLRRVDGIL